MNSRRMLGTGITCMMAVGIAIALGLWVSPAVAGKVALTDADMDGVSAGGLSTIIQSGDNSGVTYTDDSQFNLNFDVSNAQTGFRALTIQNVVGELQLLVNLNVLSANGNVAGTDQRNFSLQSWGGTLPIPGTGIVATVNGVGAAPCSSTGSCVSQGGTGATPTTVQGGSGGIADAAAGGAVQPMTGAPTLTVNSSGAANGSCLTNCTGTTGDVKGTLITGNNNEGGKAAAAPGGSGGSASFTGGNGAAGGNLTVSGSASTSPGVVAISPTASASGDLLINSGSGSPVNALDNSQFNLTFTEPNAQSDLAALFISNVVGRSQMALNLNIASSKFTTTPFEAGSITGDVTGTIKQVNTGIQFRGTPLVGSTGVSSSLNMTINHQNQ
jgi:hypothetical protein